MYKCEKCGRNKINIRHVCEYNCSVPISVNGEIYIVSPIKVFHNYLAECTNCGHSFQYTKAGQFITIKNK